MQFSYQYTLDKAFYRECFQQCAPYSAANKPKYLLLISLVALGLFSIYGLNNHYLGNFMILLAVLECIAYYFKEAWWVQRQLWSRAGGSKVEVNVTNKGIETKNRGNTMSWTWGEFLQIHRTDKGIVLVSNKGNHYLSDAHMPDGLLEQILQKVKK
ncbi:YcxB family protein [Pseudoalteromonas xiamenensis]